jgi:hypothetical protein
MWASWAQAAAGQERGAADVVAYRINPAGVQAVLVATLVPAQALGTAPAAMLSAAESAGEGCAGGTEIVSALADLLASERTRLDGMAARIEACLTGAAQATTAYVRADEQMADSVHRAQSEAVRVARGLPR